MLRADAPDAMLSRSLSGTVTLAATPRKHAVHAKATGFRGGSARAALGDKIRESGATGADGFLINVAVPFDFPAAVDLLQ